MTKTNTLLTGLTERPQLVAFSWSPGNAGIIKPRLNVDGEWVQQADLPAGASIAISITNDTSIMHNAERLV